MSQRDALRGRLFSKAVKSKIVSYNGVEIELRQPCLGTILEGSTAEDKKQVLVKMLIEHCYIPGTDEKVFEEADYDTIMNMPFDGDWIALNEAMNELTDLKARTEAAKGN